MNIINHIEKTLNIHKFEEENESIYSARLYYYSISYWIQELVKYTNIYNPNQNCTKRYLIANLKDKSIYLYDILKVPNDWLPKEDIGNFLSYLIDTKLLTYKLYLKNSNIFIENTGIKFNNKIITSYKLNNKSISTPIGYINDAKYYTEYFSNFNSKIEENKKMLNIINTKNIPVNWLCDFSFDNFEVFVPNITGLFYKSWININSINLKKKRYLIRTINNNYFNYYIFDAKKECYYLIDKYYYQEQEIYRLMYYIYLLNEFNTKIEINDCLDHSLVYLPNKIPKLESILLYNIGFPYYKWNNSNNFIISKCNLHMLNTILNELFIKGA